MNMKTMNAKDIQTQLKEHDYFANDELCLALKHAAVLEKPILIEGPPGVGKTEFAKAIARWLGQDLLRLQCSPEMNERKALYEFNYQKQLVYIQLLKNDLFAGESTTISEQIQTLEKENPFYSNSFLIKRPILQSFLPDDHQQKILLIDELDKAEEEFEYGLLEAFSDYTVSIPELGTIKATHKPITIVTSNRKRKLTDTFLRRCLYLYLDYPSIEEETEIIVKKANVSDALAKQVAQLVANIRHKELVQSPSVAESIEWASVLAIHCQEEAERELLLNTLSVITKHPSDRKKIQAMLAS